MDRRLEKLWQIFQNKNLDLRKQLVASLLRASSQYLLMAGYNPSLVWIQTPALILGVSFPEQDSVHSSQNQRIQLAELRVQRFYLNVGSETRCTVSWGEPNEPVSGQVTVANRMRPNNFIVRVGVLAALVHSD